MEILNKFKIGRIRYNKSIFRRLFASFILLSTVPILLIGIFSYRISENLIEDEILKTNNYVQEQLDKNISIYLDQLISIVNLYNLDKDLSEVLKKDYINEFNKNIDTRKVEDMMSRYSSSMYWLRHHAVLLGVNGLKYTSDGESSILSWETALSSEWYKKLKEKPEEIVWLSTQKSYFSTNNDTLVFSAAKLLQDRYTKEVYGLLLLGAEEVILYDMYKDIVSDNNSIYIIDSKGNIISSNDRSKAGTKVSDAQFPQLEPAKLHLRNTVKLNGRDYYFSIRKIQNIDWYILDLADKNSVLKRVSSLRSAIITICIFSFFILLIAAIIMSRNISLPLIRLSKKIQAYIKKHDNIDPLMNKGNEINTLDEAYERLIGKLESNIETLIEQKEKLRISELKALQMQINPHFLYNTLNSVKFLVWADKTNLIEPTINSLIELLQKTINLRDEFITISEEIENINNYVFIQRVRTCNGIKVYYDYEDSILKYKLPKLILQPLIENAIFHGIEPANREGNIYISFKEDNLTNNLRIEVYDDGVGGDQTNIDMLFSQENTDNGNRKNSIGIKNVDERIKLHFGINYGLRVRTSQNMGTSAVVTMPLVL